MSASVSELSTPSNSAANKWPRLSSAREQFKDAIFILYLHRKVRPSSITRYYYCMQLCKARISQDDTAVATFIHAWRYMMFEFKAWIDQTARRNGKHRINAAD